MLQLLNCVTPSSIVGDHTVATNNSVSLNHRLTAIPHVRLYTCLIVQVSMSYRALPLITSSAAAGTVNLWYGTLVEMVWVVTAHLFTCIAMVIITSSTFRVSKSLL